MSQQPPDEEFERRLRDVLHSRGLGVPVAADALDRVHEGARRRQQRRVVASTVAAFVVVAAIGGGIAINTVGRDSGSNRAVAAASSTTPAPTGPTQPIQPTQPTGPSQSPATARPSSSVASPRPSSPAPAETSTAVTAPTPTVYPTPGSSVPADFRPISVTAVSGKSYSVLGTQPCGNVSCTAILTTTDAGADFTEIAAPKASTVMVDNSTRPVYSLRFADSNDGWAYGDALWTTADGGGTWTDTSLAAGSVKDLEAARDPGAVSGTAWAVVQPTGGGGYELWQASYASGSGTGSWQQVDLGSDPLGDSAPSLVVKGATAYLLGSDANNLERLYVASSGVATKVYPAPCIPVGGAFSTGIGSLWTICPSTGSGMAGAVVSTDGGASWQATRARSGATGDVTASVIGGIDATTAVIDQGSALTVVSTTAQPKTATIPNPPDGFSFIGFTDAKVGFALSQGNDPALWRSTDGGLHWSVVTF